MSWAIVASVAGSVIMGSMQADAAGDAADQQQGATNRSTAENSRQFDLIRSDQAPYRAAGTSAINRLMSLLGMGDPYAEDRDRAASASGIAKPTMDQARAITSGKHQQMFGVGYSPDSDRAAIAAQEQRDYDELMAGYNAQVGKLGVGEAGAPIPKEYGSLNKKFSVEDFWADPVTQLGYQYGADLGTKALYNASPLTTGRDSGAALKELTKFGTDYAGSKAGESYGRFEGEKTNVFNRLMAMVGGGQVANQATGAAGVATANTNANLMTSQANANAAAGIAGANAWSGGVKNLSNWWQQNEMINRAFPKSTPTSNFGYTGYGAGGDYQYG